MAMRAEAAATQQALMTAEEFYDLPDHGGLAELVRGEVIEMPPEGSESSAVGYKIGYLLGAHVLPRKAGVMFAAQGGFLLARDPDVVRAPDVAFVARARLPEGRVPRRFLELAPDLAVEVVSPSDRSADIEAKVADYLEAGTRLVWVIFPEQRRVRVQTTLAEARWLSEDDTLTGDPVLPEFACAVREIFDI